MYHPSYFLKIVIVCKKQKNLQNFTFDCLSKKKSTSSLALENAYLFTFPNFEVPIDKQIFKRNVVYILKKVEFFKLCIFKTNSCVAINKRHGSRDDVYELIFYGNSVSRWHMQCHNCIVKFVTFLFCSDIKNSILCRSSSILVYCGVFL